MEIETQSTFVSGIVLGEQQAHFILDIQGRGLWRHSVATKQDEGLLEKSEDIFCPRPGDVSHDE